MFFTNNFKQPRIQKLSWLKKLDLGLGLVDKKTVFGKSMFKAQISNGGRLLLEPI